MSSATSAAFIAAAPAANQPLLGLAAAALWGASDFLGGVAARKAGALLTVVIAHSTSIAALVLMAAALHSPFPSGRTSFWAALTGLSGGGAIIVFYKALAIGEMGLTAAFTGVTTALVPVVFSWAMEGRPKGTQLFGFAIAIAAICLIAYEGSSECSESLSRQSQRFSTCYDPSSGGRLFLWKSRVSPLYSGYTHSRTALSGLGLGAIAGLGFGVFLITSKYASQGALLWPLAYSRVVSASLAWCLLAAFRLRGQPETAIAKRAKVGIFGGLLLIAGAAGILEAGGNLIYMFATLIGRLDEAAVIASLYPAFTILLAMWLLKEHATRAKTLGMALALLSVIVISL